MPPSQVESLVYNAVVSVMMSHGLGASLNVSGVANEVLSVFMNSQAAQAARVARRPEQPTTLALLQEFLVPARLSTSREDMLLGFAWSDSRGGRVYFLLKYFKDWLSTVDAPPVSRSDIVNCTRLSGGGPRFMNIRQKGLSAWWLPAGLLVGPPGAAAEPKGGLPPPREPPT